MMSVWERGTWEGLERWRLTGEELEAEFLPGYGGQVISLKHRPTGLDLLRVPKTLAELKARPFIFGIPVLFLPGRLRRGEFQLGGRSYQWPKNERGLNHLHGFVWGRPWALTPDPGGAPEVTARFEAQEHSEEAKAFSHPFRVSIRYRLEGGSLQLDARVENSGSEPMPVGFGYHTTFNLLGTEGERLQYTATMPKGEEWEMADDLMPTGTLTAPRKFAHWMTGSEPIWDVVSDNLFLVDEDVTNEIRLHLDQPEMTLWMRADPPFRNWVVYRPDPDASFISLEPVSWVHNAPNLPQPPERTGARLLPPGQSAEFSYKIGLRIGS